MLYDKLRANRTGIRDTYDRSTVDIPLYAAAGLQESEIMMLMRADMRITIHNNYIDPNVGGSAMTWCKSCSRDRAACIGNY